MLRDQPPVAEDLAGVSHDDQFADAQHLHWYFHGLSIVGPTLHPVHEGLLEVGQVATLAQTRGVRGEFLPGGEMLVVATWGGGTTGATTQALVETLSTYDPASPPPLVDPWETLIPGGHVDRVWATACSPDGGGGGSIVSAEQVKVQ